MFQMSTKATAHPTCFVIMPISKTIDQHTEEYWKKHFEDFLRPLLEQSGFSVLRSRPLRGNILTQIITDLVTASVVVADLTDHNPNVFWELGVRQSFKHGTITIAQEGTSLPFDVGMKGTLFYYPQDHLRNAIFGGQFKQALEDCLKHPDTQDSHVLETLSGRGTLFEIFRRDEAIRRLDAVISECTEDIRVVTQIVGQAKENQKDPKKRVFSTGRMRASEPNYW